MWYQNQAQDDASWFITYLLACVKFKSLIASLQLIWFHTFLNTYDITSNSRKYSTMEKYFTDSWRTGGLKEALFGFIPWHINVVDLGIFLSLQSLGNSQREYEKQVLLYSIRNQLRFRNNLGEQYYPPPHTHSRGKHTGWVTWCLSVRWIDRQWFVAG